MNGGKGPDEALLKALKSSNIDLFKSKLNEVVDPNLPDDRGWTILFHAAYRELLQRSRAWRPPGQFRPEFLDSCLKSNRVEIGHRDKDGQTILTFVLRYSLEYRAACLDIVQILLGRSGIEKLLDIGDEDEIGRAPLSWAAESGDPELSSMLIERGAKVNFQDKEGRTPLSRAAGRSADHVWGAVHPSFGERELRVVKLLCDKGANESLKDSSNRTPLMRAVEARSIPVVEYLLNRQDILDLLKEKIDDRTSFLSWVAGTRNDEIIELILQKANLPRLCKLTAQQSPETIELLLTLAAPSTPPFGYQAPRLNVNQRGDDNLTALQVAVGEKNLAMVKVLLNKGADFMVLNGYGRTPLHETARIGSTELTTLLLTCRESGPDIDKKDYAGNTPLSDAMQCQQEEVIDILLEHGASINGIRACAWTRSYKALSKIAILQLSDASKSQAGGNASQKAGRGRLRKKLESLPSLEERAFENRNKLLYVN